MDASLDAWIARSAATMCAASRWLFAESLALSLVGLASGARGGWAAVSALGVVQLYEEEAARFDAALAAAGRMPPEKVGRSMGQRAAGARRFIIAGGVVFIAQVILAAAIAWVR